MEFIGRVEKRPFASASKSAHDAIWLVTPTQAYVLQREGGNPFHDPELEKLVGKRIACKGRLLDYIVRISEWKALD